MRQREGAGWDAPGGQTWVRFLTYTLFCTIPLNLLPRKTALAHVREGTEESRAPSRSALLSCLLRGASTECHGHIIIDLVTRILCSFYNVFHLVTDWNEALKEHFFRAMMVQ